MRSTIGQLARVNSATIARKRRAGRFVVVALVCVLALLPMAGVQAQGAGPYRVPPNRIPHDLAGASAEEAGLPPGYVLPGKMIVDTDAGVDDAAALAWLLTQPQVELLGVTTVAGNTTVENATKNVLALLLSAGWHPRNPPAVYVGASKPLYTELSSTGKLINGTDGLGYARYTFEGELAGLVNLDRLVSRAPTNVTAFYCSLAPRGSKAKPVTILALGPLTNIAEAIKKCPDAMRAYQYVVLGGNRGLGNQTPSAEYNFWQDPDAADRVFTAGIEQMIVVPTDAFAQFALFLGDAGALAYMEDSYLANLVGGALAWYVGLFAGGVDGIPVSVPDPTAAMVAVYPQVFAPYLPYGYGAISEGLVKVNKAPEPEYLRGTSTMIAKDSELSAFYDQLLDGVTTADEALGKVPAWQAALYELYTREGPNAQVVLYPDGNAMRNCFLQAFGLTMDPVFGTSLSCPLASAAAANPTLPLAGIDASTIAANVNEEPGLFLPMIASD